MSNQGGREFGGMPRWLFGGRPPDPPDEQAERNEEWELKRRAVAAIRRWWRQKLALWERVVIIVAEKWEEVMRCPPRNGCGDLHQLFLDDLEALGMGDLADHCRNGGVVSEHQLRSHPNARTALPFNTREGDPQPSADAFAGLYFYVFLRLWFLRVIDEDVRRYGEYMGW
jgi:hypothetical protein